VFLRTIFCCVKRNALVELCDSCHTIPRATTWSMADVTRIFNGSTLPKDN
jgi:hypothetical protein